MIPEFGSSAWGRAWLALAEGRNIETIDARLPRARSLARHGAVHDLRTIEGAIHAVVDHRRYVLPVSITFPLWGPAERVLAAQAFGDPTTSAVFASGDVPDKLEASLAASGVHAAPEDVEVDFECACAEARSPCLHGLAVCYAIVQQIDEEPALALRLRGLTPPPRPRADSWIPLSAIDPATFYIGGGRSFK